MSKPKAFSSSVPPPVSRFLFCAAGFFSLLLQAVLQVCPRRGNIEQGNTLDAHRQRLVAPVGEEYRRDGAALVGRGETAVARLLAGKAHDFGAVLVEDDDRDGKGEVFEILTDTEEISGEVVIHNEPVYIVLDLCGAFVGIVLQPGTIAHLGIELRRNTPATRTLGSAQI